MIDFLIQLQVFSLSVIYTYIMIVQAPLKISMIIISDYIGIKSDYNLIYIMYKYKLYALIYNTYRVYMFDTFHLQLLLFYVQRYTSFHPREPPPSNTTNSHDPPLETLFLAGRKLNPISIRRGSLG
jgi:hypothetical protein